MFTRMHRKLAFTSIVFCSIGFLALVRPSEAQQPSDQAAVVLEKCDKLASLPGDPNIVAPAVPDSQFAPGAAIPACEEAVRLNPELARSRFELGRSYWIGQREAEAFKAFLEAAKRCYPPAKKFIGDAYLEGRGLPSGEQRDIQRAIDWYKDAATATPDCKPGYRDAERAVREAQARIDQEKAELANREAEAAKARYDASIFQRGDFLTYVYNVKMPPTRDIESFRIYMHGFVMELGGDQILFVDSKCKPLVPSRTAVVVRDSMFSMFAIQPRAGLAQGNYQGWLNTFQFNVFTEGQRDAVELVNHYHCDSEVARKLVDNIGRLYDVTPRETQETTTGPARKMRRQDGVSYVAKGDRFASPKTAEDCADVCSKDTDCGRATFWFKSNRCFLFTPGSRTANWGYKDSNAVSFSFE
jgi:tetratricopeptide (TPR) repeat protein